MGLLDNAHLPAGMRNNNLGNIGDFGQKMQGMVPNRGDRDVDHSIATFVSQEDGIRAAERLALKKYNNGMTTASQLIAGKGGWTPGALGPGAAVNVAAHMGIGPNDDLNLSDPSNRVKFLRGLAIQEHGKMGEQFYTPGLIAGALSTTVPAGLSPSPSSGSVTPQSSTPSTTTTATTPSAGSISATTPSQRGLLDIGSYDAKLLPNTLGNNGVNAGSFAGSIPGRWDEMNMPMSMNKPSYDASMVSPDQSEWLTPELKFLKSGVQLHANPLPSFAVGSDVTPTQGGTVTTPSVAPTIDRPVTAHSSPGVGHTAGPSTGGGLLQGNTPAAPQSSGGTMTGDATKPTDKKWSDILGSATSGLPKTPLAQAPDLQPANLIPQVDADWQARMNAARSLMATLLQTGNGA